MARKISKLGTAVKGALAACLSPRIAADKAIKPGEIDQLLLSIPRGKYKTQIPLIADSVKKTFGPRLAQDANVDDLAALLEALGDEDDYPGDAEPAAFGGKETNAEEELEKGKKPEGVAGDDDPGSKLIEMISKYDIPADDLEQITALIAQLGKGAAAATDEDIDDDPTKPKKPEDKPVTKGAMDAALARNSVAERKRLAAIFSAAEDVAPVLGKIDTLAFDSADAILKLALDHLGVPTEGVHPSAYRTLFKMKMSEQPTAPATVLADQKSVEDFEKRYTHIPTQL